MGGSFRSGVQPPTGTIPTAPTLDRRPPTAPGPPSTILAPHSFTVRPSRTLLIANKRIQRRTLIKQITSPQMLKQPPTRKSVGSRRIQNTKCPRLIQTRANLPVSFRLRLPSKSPAQNPVLIHKIPFPFHTHPADFPAIRLTDTFSADPLSVYCANASIRIHNLPISPANREVNASHPVKILCRSQPLANLPACRFAIRRRPLVGRIAFANIRRPVQNRRPRANRNRNAPRPVKKLRRRKPPANLRARRLTTRRRPNIRRFTNTNIRLLIPTRRRRATRQSRALPRIKKQRNLLANFSARRPTTRPRLNIRRRTNANIILNIPHRQPDADSQRTTNIIVIVEELRKPTANIRTWRLTLSRCCVKNLRRRASGTIKPVVSWRSKPNLATTTKTPLRIRANRIRPARIRRCRALIHISKPHSNANLIPPACRNRATLSARPRAIPRPNPNRPPSKSPCLKNHRNPMQNRPPNRRLRPPDPRQNRPPGPCRKVNRRPRQPRHYRNRRIPNQNLPCQNPRTLPCPRVKVRRKTNIATPEPPPFPTRNIPPLIRPRRKNNRRPSRRPPANRQSRRRPRNTRRQHSKIRTPFPNNPKPLRKNHPRLQINRRRNPAPQSPGLPPNIRIPNLRPRASPRPFRNKIPSGRRPCQSHP